MVGFHEAAPVVLELNRLQNMLKEKDRQMGIAQTEIKALKAADVLKEKAIEELANMMEKLEEKLRDTQKLVHQKNLEMMKLATEKKEALAAQFAAEATLRRVHASQKEDDTVPIESIIAPLEADIRMYKNEVALLQEDKKTLERHTKSKEAALLEAERILTTALERAVIVEEVQNQNIQLRRQIEIYQEENKILEKSNRQQSLDVEKLGETIKELEEAILAGGAAANAIRDYRRQISELQEEKRTLEREVARAHVSANRVATTVANEWKDDKDKVMPVKQWLEERRIMQAEMQRLRDKLSISERTAKSEALLKEKVKLRLKTLEEGLKQSNHFSGFLSSNGGRKRSTSQPRGSRRLDVESDSKKHASGQDLVRKSLWASRSKGVDRDEKENSELILHNTAGDGTSIFRGRETASQGSEDRSTTDDVVSGFLYDRLQKEVIHLRKLCKMKDNSLTVKDEENKMLMTKMENLIKAQEAESKKWKREATIRDKNPKSIKTDEHKPIRNLNSSKRGAKAS